MTNSIDRQVDDMFKLVEMVEERERTRCVSCRGEGTHIRTGYDVAPTDSGYERRYKEEWYCEECDPQVQP